MKSASNDDPLKRVDCACCWSRSLSKVRSCCRLDECIVMQAIFGHKLVVILGHHVPNPSPWILVSDRMRSDGSGAPVASLGHLEPSCSGMSVAGMIAVRP